MRALRLALAASAFLAASAGAALPQLALGCAIVPAGQPATCTITRLSGGQGVYVTLQTSDGTAKAGTDYTATRRMVYLKGSDKSAAVAIPTMANPNATGMLTFSAAVTAGTVVVTAMAGILEASPAPPPPPAPPSAWVQAPLAVGGFACSAIQSGHDNVPPCGEGIVYRITGAVPNGGSSGPGLLYTAVFYSDASGQFPVNDPYDTSFVSVWSPADLQGLAPAG